MVKKPIEAVIFDFDGTLADSVGMICEMIDNLTESDFDKEELREISREGLVEISKKLNLPLWSLPFFIFKVKRNLKSKVSMIKPFPGISGLLQALKSEGCQLAIVTNNRTDIVKSFLKRNNLLLFSWISGTTFSFNKAKRMEKILSKKEIDPKKTIYIGDQVSDIIAARKAGMISLAVTWGFDSKDSLMRKCPDFIASDPDDIIKYIKSKK